MQFRKQVQNFTMSKGSLRLLSIKINCMGDEYFTQLKCEEHVKDKSSILYEGFRFSVNIFLLISNFSKRTTFSVNNKLQLIHPNLKLKRNLSTKIITYLMLTPFIF